MLTLLEVRQLVDKVEPGRPTSINLARLDLTENTETERSDALLNARILYGNGCNYTWHFCGHDVGLPCTVRGA